jgi:hypothetical protein
VLVPVQPTPQAGPAPVLRPAYEVGAQRVALHVPADGIQVLVALDTEGLEPALIDMSGPRSVVMRVPAHAVRVRQPAAEGAQVPVPFGPEHEVPVVGHQDEGQHARRVFRQRLGQHAQERVVVGRLFKQGQPGHAAVQHVVDEAIGGMSRSSAHGADASPALAPGQGKTSCVLFSFRPGSVASGSARPGARPAWDDAFHEMHRVHSAWRRVGDPRGSRPAATPGTA